MQLNSSADIWVELRLKINNFHPIIKLVLGLAISGIFFGCSTLPEVLPNQEVQGVKSTATFVPTSTTSSRPWSTSTISAPLKSPTSITLVCSPLDGYHLQDTPDKISNKFSPPNPDSDEPHQGIDFSITDEVSGIAYGGNLVNAVLTGEVSTIIDGRFPYGHAIIIETPFESLPQSFLEGILLPTPSDFQIGHPILSCPEEQTTEFLNNLAPNVLVDRSIRSLYLLYAHLQEIKDFQPGQKIHCGQNLGLVGDSGNALNPHLHLEIRVGPPGVRFSNLAHYDSSASLQEMANYCIWRISGLFQLVDPMEIFLGKP
jgi:murein DD-endopeptidase MepM/ murein hydrolase activator NlpD